MLCASVTVTKRSFKQSNSRRVMSHCDVHVREPSTVFQHRMSYPQFPCITLWRTSEQSGCHPVDKHHCIAVFALRALHADNITPGSAIVRISFFTGLVHGSR
ncbi:hypothetical protein BLA50215_04988 [Burkholderia lata]|nr:hypothetical protein BLA50215_04988 [Burkholderia lata]